jgi:hypothetical protein
MSYRNDLKRLRRARQQLKRQRHDVLALELEGIVTLTLHSVARSLTLPLLPETRGELVDLLLAALRQRRLLLQAEVDQTRADWQQTLALAPQPADSSPPSTPPLGL